MKINLKVDSKELSMLITGLRKTKADNEYLLNCSTLSADARFMAEVNIEKIEKLIKHIENAHAAQTLQYMPKGDKK